MDLVNNPIWDFLRTERGKIICRAGVGENGLRGRCTAAQAQDKGTRASVFSADHHFGVIRASSWQLPPPLMQKLSGGHCWSELTQAV